jgi:nucleotide-binding universal stress UspA family protein
MKRLAMNTFKHILVPTDFSPSSEAAIDTAIDLAQRFDAKVTLLHVWQLPIYPYMEAMMNMAALTGEVERGATEALEKQVQQVRGRFPGVQSALQMGLPWQAILELVKAQQVDLVVMGTHGRRGFEHLMLGSVAEKVVRLSPVPVLTVRGPVAT